MSHKTTAKNFNYFSDRVYHWQRELGLTEWEINCEHSCGDIPNAMASVTFNVADRCAMVYLPTEWTDRKVNQYELDRAAIHECLELILADIHEDLCRELNNDKISKLLHPVIRRIENLLLQK